jgi:hypothetical protein
MMQRPSELARGNGTGLRLKARQFPATDVMGILNAECNLIPLSPPEVLLGQVSPAAE